MEKMVINIILAIVCLTIIFASIFYGLLRIETDFDMEYLEQLQQETGLIYFLAIIFLGLCILQLFWG